MLGNFYLGRLESQLEELGRAQSRHAVIIQRLVCPDSVFHVAEIQEGVAKGSNPGGEDSPISELSKLVEDLKKTLHCDVGGDVAQPHAGAGCVGCLPVQITLALEVLLPRRRAAEQGKHIRAFARGLGLPWGFWWVLRHEQASCDCTALQCDAGWSHGNMHGHACDKL